MDTNRDNPGQDAARVGEGSETVNLGAARGSPSGWAPTEQIPPSSSTPPPQQQTSQAYGYVPPEIRPTGADYGGQGEAPRQSGPAPYPPAQAWAAPQRPVVEAGPRHTPILWPLLLIVAGIIFLLNTLEIVDWSVWGQLWRLWPLVLVAIGLDLLIGRRNPVLSLLIVVLVLAAGGAFLYATGGLRPVGERLRADLSVPLSAAKSAQVEIQSGVSRLDVDGEETALLASGTLQYYESSGPPVQNVNRSGDAVTLRITQSDSHRGFNWGGQQGQDWKIHLNPQVPTKLTVDTGVGETNLDLRDLKLTDLDLHVGVGATTATMPAGAGTTSAKVDGGVGSLDLYIPEGVGARISVDSGLGGIDVDSRFAKQAGDVYQSSDYNQATNKLDLTVHVGVGGVNIRSR
jgi:hypothetical protein